MAQLANTEKSQMSNNATKVTISSVEEFLTRNPSTSKLHLSKNGSASPS